MARIVINWGPAGKPLYEDRHVAQVPGFGEHLTSGTRTGQVTRVNMIAHEADAPSLVDAIVWMGYVTLNATWVEEIFREAGIAAAI